jgi:hypothetical protein
MLIYFCYNNFYIESSVSNNIIILLSLYSIFFILSGNNFTILAQLDLKTTKYLDLVIDLGDGVKTNARLNIPAIDDGPFPAVLLLPGSTCGYE